jgi:hypothetical protein
MPFVSLARESEMPTFVEGTILKQSFALRSLRKCLATAACLLSMGCQGTTNPDPPLSQTAAALTGLSVTLTEPIDGAFIGPYVYLRVEAQADSGIDRVELFDGERLLGQPQFDNVLFLSDLSAMAAGPHSLTAVAHDLAGNTTRSAPVHVTVDHTPPSVAAAYTPALSGSVSGVIRADVTASDDVGLARVELLQDNLTDLTDVIVATATVPPYVFAWNTTALANGPYLLTARAWDKAGNYNDFSLRAQVDNSPANPPTVVITSPGENQAVSDSTFVVTYQAVAPDGLAEVQFYIDGGLSQSAPFASTTLFFPAASLAAGVHTLTARAVDVRGNAGVTGPIHFLVDRTPPTLSTTLTPSGSERPVAGTVQIGVVANDNIKVQRVEIYDGADTLALLTSPPYSFAWDTTKTADGPHGITVRVYDTAGNLAESYSPAFVSNYVSVSTYGQYIGYVPGYSAVGGTARVQANWKLNPIPAGNKVEFFEGDVIFATVTAPPYEAIWHPTFTGLHGVGAHVTDSQGRVYTSPAYPVDVDLEAPPSILTGVNENGVVIGSVQLGATTDAWDVYKVEFYDGTKLIGSEVTRPFTQLWNASTVPIGAHTLHARAFDAVGNAADSPPIHVTVKAGKPDVTPPKVSFSAPTNGKVVSATTTLSASASDNAAISRVEFYDGSVLLRSISVAPYSFGWNTEDVGLGTHKLVVRAFDTSGNSASATISVVVEDRTPPQVYISSPVDGGLVDARATVTIAADAWETRGVSRVEFYVAGALKCTDKSVPFSCAWVVPSGAGKKYSLQAKAFDFSANSRASVTVTVKSR